MICIAQSMHNEVTTGTMLLSLGNWIGDRIEEGGREKKRRCRRGAKKDEEKDENQRKKMGKRRKRSQLYM